MSFIAAVAVAAGYTAYSQSQKTEALSDLALELLARKYGLSNQVKLVGYRNDIEKYYSAADIFAFPSKREGLSFAGVEAMSSGLPIVGSNVRGVKDYVYDGKSGFLLNPNDDKGFARRIGQLTGNEQLREQMGKFNIKTARKYDIHNVQNIMKKIYFLNFKNKLATKLK